jgi:hypothetical protein
VDRIERRTQFTDTIAKTMGRHTVKFGADVNLIQLRSSKAQIFELDFGGVVNFGGLPAATFSPFFAGLPGATGVQAYGFGIPTTYIQGIGNSNQPFDNLPFGFFAQDDWKVTRKLTVNIGTEYSLEFPITERHNRKMWFDPTAQLPISQQVGRNLTGGFRFADDNTRSATGPVTLEQLKARLLASGC